MDSDTRPEDQSDLVIAHNEVETSEFLFDEANSDEIEIDESKIQLPTDTTNLNPKLTELQNIALQQTESFSQTINQIDTNLDNFFGTDLASRIAKYEMKENFKKDASQLLLPQFFMQVPKHDLFTEGQEEVLLNKQTLLAGFDLAQEDIKIAFEDVGSSMYEVDIKETNK